MTVCWVLAGSERARAPPRRRGVRTTATGTAQHSLMEPLSISTLVAFERLGVATFDGPFAPPIRHSLSEAFDTAIATQGWLPPAIDDGAGRYRTIANLTETTAPIFFAAAKHPVLLAAARQLLRGEVELRKDKLTAVCSHPEPPSSATAYTYHVDTQLNPDMTWLKTRTVRIYDAHQPFDPATQRCLQCSCTFSAWCVEPEPRTMAVDRWRGSTNWFGKPIGSAKPALVLCANQPIALLFGAAPLSIMPGSHLTLAKTYAKFEPAAASSAFACRHTAVVRAMYSLTLAFNHLCRYSLQSFPLDQGGLAPAHSILTRPAE
eukprot:SAG31_NODE_2785_length_5092_cov_4.652914_1_plen_319_part_00